MYSLRTQEGRFTEQPGPLEPLLMWAKKRPFSDKAESKRDREMHLLSLTGRTEIFAAHKESTKDVPDPDIVAATRFPFVEGVCGGVLKVIALTNCCMGPGTVHLKIFK